MGKRIVRGALRGVEEGTQFSNYRLYGYRWLEDRFLAMCTFKISEFLEENRWEAVPILNLPVQIPPMGISVEEGRPEPNVLVDVEKAAVRAGLGEIGYLGVFLSPEYGPRQRMQAIITDAELDEDPLFEGQICDRSKTLADLCPLEAIDPNQEQTIEICGKKMVVAKINHNRCKGCQNGSLPNRFHPAGLPDRLGALCIRSNMSHLEKTGKTTKAFRNEFRKREPWTVLSKFQLFDEEQDIE